jgi:peroxiredoxin
MNIKNNLLLISTLILSTLHTSAQEKPAKKFEISGTVALRAFGTAYLYYEKEGSITLDSSKVVNGKFKISGQIDRPVFARLVFTPLTTDSTRPRILNFFMEPGVVKLSSTDTLKNVAVSGSKSDVDFLPIRNALKVHNAKLGELNEEARRYQADQDTAGLTMVRKKMDDLEMDFKNQVYRRYAEQHLESQVSLYALDQVAGGYLNSEEIEPMFNKLSPEVRDSKAGRDFAKKIETAKATSKGGFLPDFSQPDTSGTLVSLSSFRGKYVLVDFWASWCMPCREESPRLVKAFRTYSGKGFTILGVSLDKSKDSWLKAIRTDKLFWPQVSDLKYWDNEVAKKFDIRFVPQNMLIDPSGKILARNIHGDELDEALSEIFK